MADEPNVSTTPTQPPTHKPNGQFAKGNKLGPGNPYAKRVHQLKQAVYATVTMKDLKGVIKAMVHKAQQGDVAAARLIMEYAIGKPDMVQPIQQGQQIDIQIEAPNETTAQHKPV